MDLRSTEYDPAYGCGLVDTYQDFRHPKIIIREAGLDDLHMTPPIVLRAS